MYKISKLMYTTGYAKWVLSISDKYEKALYEIDDLQYRLDYADKINIANISIIEELKKENKKNIRKLKKVLNK